MSTGGRRGAEKLTLRVEIVEIRKSTCGRGRRRGGCEVLLIVVCRRECGGVWLLDGRSTPLGLCVGPHSPFPLPLGGCAKSYIHTGMKNGGTGPRVHHTK